MNWQNFVKQYNLEISSVNLKQLFGSNRLDAEAYKPNYLDQANNLNKIETTTLNDLSCEVDASAFYPSLEPFYGLGNIPFLRVSDVNKTVDYDNCIYIPAEIIEKYKTLKLVNEGDILITKGGTVARIGIATKKAAVSRDLVFIKSSKLPRKEYIYLYLYLLSDTANQLLLRGSSQSVQPHLTVTMVRELPVPKVSDKIKDKLLKTYIQYNELLNKSREHFKKANLYLMEIFNSEKLSINNEKTTSKNWSEVLKHNRFDSEYWLPKYEDLLSVFGNNYTPLYKLFDVLKGINVKYSIDGKYKVIKTKQLKNYLIDIDSCEDLSNMGIEIQDNDLIFASMGVGSLGKIDIFYSDHYPGKYVIDGTLQIFRKPKNVLSEYLLVLFRLPLYQKLIYRYIVGSSGIISISKDDVSQLPVPNIDKKIQMSIAYNIKLFQSLRKESDNLLEFAKQTIDILIMHGEKKALLHTY